jgi:hypothetical protein
MGFSEFLTVGIYLGKFSLVCFKTKGHKAQKRCVFLCSWRGSKLFDDILEKKIM